MTLVVNDDRPESGGLGEVFQDAIESNRRAVHQLEIGLGAGVKLAPDFAVVSVHDFQAAFHVGLIETGGISDKHDSGLRQAFGAFDLGHDLHALGEVVDQGRLAVTAECDVLDVAGDERRQFVELGFLGQSAVAHEMNHRLQYVAHLVQVQS